MTTSVRLLFTINHIQTTELCIDKQSTLFFESQSDSIPQASGINSIIYSYNWNELILVRIAISVTSISEIGLPSDCAFQPS